MTFFARLAALGICAGATLLASCRGDPEPPSPAYLGTMRSSCAPHDAPSTAFFLEAVDGADSVTFNVWPPGGLALPAAIEFDADRPVGQGVYCTSPEACEPAAWGEIAVEDSADSAEVRGEWSLGLADGRDYRGIFTAQWLAIQALCG